MGVIGLGCDSFVSNNLGIKHNIIIMMIYMVLGIVLYFGFLVIRKDKTVVNLMSSLRKKKMN